MTYLNPSMSRLNTFTTFLFFQKPVSFRLLDGPLDCNAFPVGHIESIGEVAGLLQIVRIHLVDDLVASMEKIHDH